MAGAGVQLVIFDCDGVLVDSEPISVDVLRQTVFEAGGEIGEHEAYDRFLGRSTAAVAQILTEEFELSISANDLEAMRRRLFRRFEAELQPVEGVADTLDRLEVPACVASSSQPDRIRLSLRLAGLLERFEPNIFSSTMVKSGKPAPDLFLHAAAAMGADPSGCVVIEDSPAGIEAAKRAGMRVLAFLGGAHGGVGRLRETIIAMRPDAIFEDMRELPQILLAQAVEDETNGRPAPASGRQAGARHRDLVCAVDVGTLSTRAGIFDARGNMLSRAEQVIELLRPADGHAEHASEDIWRASCAAVGQALEKAGVDAGRIAGIGFDATCSLVIRGPGGEPVTVATTREQRTDTIAWLDHRALEEADELTASGHRVLEFIGGIMSPEMQTPKLLWLKRHLPQSWQAAGRFFDLADFLTWRATGDGARSQCTLTAKWTYLAHDGGWQHDFLDSVGLEDMLERGGLPQTATPVGKPCGRLTDEAATTLGLDTGCMVATGMIDAFAGMLGSIGGVCGSAEGDDVERNVALIAGTSSCIMGMSGQPLSARGVWGPYFGAALPEKWVWEGGQSATGALLDHVIRIFGNGRQPEPQTHRDIIRRIGELREAEGESFAADIHVIPDFHGNRSPFADPHARGVIAGLTLDQSFDSLCRIYWRTALGIALGLRQIIEHLNAHGRRIEALHVVGGHRWNPLLMELYADATGLDVCEPRTGDAVLLGTAMLAAAASGLYADLPSACAAMASGRSVRTPCQDPVRTYERDYEMFKSLQKLGRG